MKRSRLAGIVCLVVIVSLTSCDFLFGKKENPATQNFVLKGQWKIDTLSFIGKDTNQIHFASALALFDAKKMDSIPTYVHFNSDSTLQTIEGKDTSHNRFTFDAEHNQLCIGKDSTKQFLQLNIVDSNHISLQTKDSILFTLIK